jgi:nucleotide-binding universal stress UspA family protein
MPAKLQKMHILMADDNSENAAAAVSLLCELDLSPRSTIFVLRVFEIGQTHSVWLFEDALSQTHMKLSAAGHNVKSDLLLGQPAPKIVEIAAEQRADLIVMGSVGLRATLGILLGGVAQQVVEHAGMPVLVVRKPYNGLKHVLFATDGSDCSLEALRYIKQFPFPADVRFSVISVLPPEMTATNLAWTEMMDTPVPPMSPDLEANLERIAAKEQEDGEALIARTARSLKKLEVPVEAFLCRGDAATEIIDYAKKNSVDLIVVGSRGLGAVRGWLMGSVSRKLVHYAPCSVMVVKKCEAS